ncbi:MAG: F0F1 ATP synthase subunit B [Acidobacteriota bacterium]|nr:MAG: ATP synthase F0 subunit B [Acidobacteriota bacterium]
MSAPIAILAAGGGDALMRLEVNLWVWTLIIFLAVVLILWRGGWKVMIAKLDARDEAIRGAIEKAKRAREEAETLLAEQKAALDAARREAAEMLQNVQQEASRERQRILEQAREEYERIVQRGREQIDNETRAALERIRAQVAELSLEVAGRLLRARLDPATHRELAERFVAEIERGGGSPTA